MADKIRKRKRADEAAESPNAPPPLSPVAQILDSPAHNLEEIDNRNTDDESKMDRPARQPKGDAYYRGLYNRELDFRHMASQDPEFAAVLTRSGQLDFTDPAAVMQLTKSTLKRDFGLTIELPDDRLCPPVHNRHNYILWLKDLLDSSSYAEPGARLAGIDIGTGASCIYPLLGCTQRPWDFIGTDLDEKSLSYAAKNVRLNGLEHRIRLVRRHRSTDPLIPLDDLQIDLVDFVMTNPPFYESEDELLALAKKKARPPSSACTGAPVEMVCDGGEVGFVGRILEESLALRGRVRWYTSMVGKLTSLDLLVARLRAEKVDNYAVTEFVQGSRTRRWAIAWSFDSMRPSESAARGMAQLPWRKHLPLEVDAEIGPCAIEDVGAVAGGIDWLMQSLELFSWTWDKQDMRGVARTRENVWARAWRRRKAREKTREQTDAGTPANVTPSGHKVISGFAVSIVVGATNCSVSCRWREGHDEAMFQSFCGFLKGKLDSMRHKQSTSG